MKNSATLSSSSLRLPAFIHSSSESALVESFTPSGMQECMRLSTAENLWRYMHSEQQREVRISKSERGKRGGTLTKLSELTARANQRLESGKGGEERWSMTHSSTQPSFRPHSPRLPNDSDYKRIQERLNRVYTQGGADSLKVTLAEGKNYEYLLEAGDWLYAKVSVAGSLCPLVVRVVRNRGRLVAYSSRTIQEPSASLYDSRFTTDRIWISDSSLRFSQSPLYLSFHALEESAFSLSLEFGQRRKLQPRGKWKNEGGTVFNQEEWVKLFSEMTAGIRERKKKDFVEMNRHSVSSRDRPRADVVLHRQETMRKWRERLEAKRLHALTQLNRAQLKEIQRQQEAEKAKERLALAQAQSKFVAVLWAIKAAEQLRAAFQHHRTLQLLQHMKIMAVLKIQVAFKRHANHKGKHEIALKHAALGLRCVGKALAAIQIDSIRLKVALCIQKSANKARLPILLTTFYRKSNHYLVLFIQSNWRLSHLRRKRHYDSLLSLYNSTLSRLLLPSSKKKTSKSRKNKENSVNRYLTISLAVKNHLLEQHFRSARQRLKEEMRTLGEENKGKYREKPVFKLDMTAEDMVKLIEQAAELSLNARS